MGFPRDLSWRRGLFWLTLFLATGIAGGTLFVALGVYNVSASVSHFFVTERIIKFVLNQSIRTHSPIDTPEQLDNASLARLGARHYQLGCAPCHGTPGRRENPIMQKMYPAPPDLGGVALKWEPSELAWIIQNGLKFTGMPAWAGQNRKDEVWALVAFLRQLPDMTENDYAALASGQYAVSSETPALPSQPINRELCISCHGDEENPPISANVPALSGQTAAYLRRALTEYRRDQRQSGMMEPIAAVLNDAEIDRLANHFARHETWTGRQRQSDRGNIERGRKIATAGQTEAGVPPCLACHGSEASERFPRLRGLSQEYIVGQLRLFRSGARDQTAYGSIMSSVAKRLTPEQIDDVAAYLATDPETRRTGR